MHEKVRVSHWGLPQPLSTLFPGVKSLAEPGVPGFK